MKQGRRRRVAVPVRVQTALVFRVAAHPGRGFRRRGRQRHVERAFVGGDANATSSGFSLAGCEDRRRRAFAGFTTEHRGHGCRTEGLRFIPMAAAAFQSAHAGQALPHVCHSSSFAILTGRDDRERLEGIEGPLHRDR